MEFGRTTSCSVRNGGCDQICIEPLPNLVTLFPLSRKRGKSARRKITKSTSAPKLLHQMNMAPKALNMIEPSEETLSSVVKSEEDFDLPNPDDMAWNEMAEIEQQLVTCGCNEGYELKNDGFSCQLKPSTSTITIETSTEPIFDSSTNLVEFFDAETVCSMPLLIGDCEDPGQPMWYYDRSMDTCFIFSYTGCGGNANR